MFYCDNCAKTNQWPETAFGSYGKCEMCGVVARCNDVPSSALPPARPRYCEHGNGIDRPEDCAGCQEENVGSDMHVMMGMVPVFVYVKDGEVVRVVVDDADVQFGDDPKVFKTEEGYAVSNEVETDPVWERVVKSAVLDPHGSKKPWAAWEWGW